MARHTPRAARRRLVCTDAALVAQAVLALFGSSGVPVETLAAVVAGPRIAYKACGAQGKAPGDVGHREL